MEAEYLKDCYKKEFDTKVKSVFEGKYIVLEDTIFYPNAGGQPYDTGKLIRDDGKEFEVIFVGKFSDEISHEVSGEGLSVGDSVKCILDWDRRYKNMRMHTAAHVISRVMFNEFMATTSGNQLDVEKSRIDFKFDEFDKEKVFAVFDKINEIISNGAIVEKSFMDREDALKIEGFAAPSPHLMIEDDILRVVNIKGIDAQPCGGTHLDDIKEIGRVEFVKADNKGKNNRRISYRLND